MRKIFIAVICSLLCISYTFSQEVNLMDYFSPMEPQSPLVSDGIWGVSDVFPRDTANGLEDALMENWCYWDGSIVKDEEGKYHMYASKWDQSLHHSTGWNEASKAMHAVADNPLGPYRDQGLAWPYWNEGKAHNTIGLRVHDGRYAMITSEITQGEVFISDSPYGPWEFHGQIEIDYNGFEPGSAHYNNPPFRMANVMVIIRPDGRYQIMPRQCSALISENGILGPYKIMAGASWKDVPDVPQKYMEDPTVWYSDSMYHCVVNYYEHSDLTYHLTSLDGAHNWKRRGIAFEHDKGIFRYTDGTINEWYTVQRPTVFTENGQVTHFNFSVIDVHKGKDGGNDNHGSKIIVVPFDGANFGKDLLDIVREENATIDETSLPGDWTSVDIGAGIAEGNSGFETGADVYRIKSAGSGVKGAIDECRFVYQQMSDDATIFTQVNILDPYQNNTQAGVMIRKSLDANAETVCLSLTKNNNASLKHRAVAGENISEKLTPNIYTLYWLRLSKIGNKVISYVSTNPANNWTAIDTIPIDFGSDFYVGLAASSGGSGTLATTTYRKPYAYHHAGEQDFILSHNLPEHIPLSGKVDIDVEYVTSTERDIVIGIRDITDWHGVGDTKVTVNGYGTTTVNYSPSQELDPTHRYQIEINMRPKGGDWRTDLFKTQKVWTSFILDTVYLTGIELSETSLALDAGDTTQLRAAVAPSDATVQSVIWKSDKPEVAAVDYVLGKVTAIGGGVANVTAMSSHDTTIKATCVVSVEGGSHVQENYDAARLPFYPNPFDTELVVLLNKDSKSTVRLMDLAGKTLKSYNSTGSEEMVLSPSYTEVPEGLYLLQISDEHRVDTFNVIRI